MEMIGTNMEKCIRCGARAEVCPTAALSIFVEALGTARVGSGRSFVLAFGRVHAGDVHLDRRSHVFRPDSGKAGMESGAPESNPGPRAGAYLDGLKP